jgi:ketosteroid isomerase-like protein
MSQENVEIVRRAFEYETYGRGRRSEVEADFEPDVILKPFEELPARGREHILDNIKRWRSAWEDLQVTVEEVIDAGDQVIVVARHRGQGRESGIDVDARFYEVYTLREGKISRIEEFIDRGQALEAAGLRE